MANDSLFAVHNNIYIIIAFKQTKKRENQYTPCASRKKSFSIIQIFYYPN